MIQYSYQTLAKIAVLIFCSLTLAGCSKELNRKTAQKVLMDYYSGLDSMFLTDTASSSINFTYDGIENAIQQGYVDQLIVLTEVNGETMEIPMGMEILALTPKAGNFTNIKSLEDETRYESRVHKDENILFLGNLKNSEVVKTTVKTITGITTTGGEGSESCYVDYIVQISLPHKLKPEFINFLKTEYTRRALLKRYDDGWRVEEAVVEE